MGISLPPPPPEKNKIIHMEFVLEEICHRGEGLPYGIIPPPGKFCHGISSGGGGGGCHMVLFPPGEVLLWDFFRGKVYHMVFLHGERLPYGIISGGTICHGICSLIMTFVWEEEFTIEGEPLPYGIVFTPWGSSAKMVWVDLVCIYYIKWYVAAYGIMEWSL